MLTLNKQGVRARNRDIQKEARLGWIKNSMPAGHMTRTEYKRRTQVKSCEDQCSVSTIHAEVLRRRT